jgi:hypothetical protein
VEETGKSPVTTKPCLIDVDAASFDRLPCCGIKSPTHPGRQQKLCWLQANAKFGLRAQMLLAPDGEPGGYIEYLPGEFAWRGVEAAGLLFIHCVWIFRKQDQRKGFARAMVAACLEDARKAGMRGAAVRDGPWLPTAVCFWPTASAGRYRAAGLPVTRSSVRVTSANPAFKKGWDERLAKYGRGLTIVRSNQCPHIAKFAAEIIETAESEYHVKPTVIDLQSWRDAQKAAPYAIFSLIYNGRLLADHQISRTRFRNIMNKCVRSGRLMYGGGPGLDGQPE